MSGEDWLGSMDAPDVDREEKRAQGLDFARLHLVFHDDARGRELLEFWQRTVMRKRVSVDSPVQVYAAHEAVRAFISVIEDQLKFAQNDGYRP